MDWQIIGARLAPILAVVFGLGTLGCIVGIARLRRKARATSFGFVRDRSTMYAKRLLFAAILLLVLTGASAGLWSASRWKPEILPTAVPTVTSTLIPSPTPRTPTATPTPTSTPTATPTLTVTPIPPDADLPAALRTPFPAVAATPGPGAVLVEVVLAAGEQGNRPIDPGTQFSRVERIYAFFTFDGMARDVPWIHVWYGEVDGQMVEVWSQVELWPYDDARGGTWRYFNCRPGQYKLEVYVGRQLQQQVSFTVNGE